MVAVNAVPAAVLLTDGANNTAAAHFLLATSSGSSSQRADMSSTRHATGATAVNITNGLLLYYHQCSFYSQKVGREQICFCDCFI